MANTSKSTAKVNLLNSRTVPILTVRECNQNNYSRSSFAISLLCLVWLLAHRPIDESSDYTNVNQQVRAFVAF